MNLNTRLRLSVMMFVQYFIWGAWYATLSSYLTKINFTGNDIGRAYSTTALAAIVSPFFVGMIADRFFSAEKVLAVLHLVGAGLLFYVSTIKDPMTFYYVLLAYTLCYMPTLALTNSLSFDHMKDPSKDFPSIRVMGTISWIVVGWILAKFEISDKADSLQLGAGASLLMGLYCFTLPHTPPKSAGKAVKVRDILGLDALGLMKDPSFLFFVIGSLLICIPLTFYFSFTGTFLSEHNMSDWAGKMTLGQMLEIFFLMILPFCLARLGVKKMLLIGMLAWGVRYVLFAFGDPGSKFPVMVLAGIIMHGICYDFFFVTGQLYVDRKAPLAIRANAQGLIYFITLGLGMYIGSRLSGVVVDHFTTLNDAKEVVARNWKMIWLTPAAMAGVVLVLFALFFHENGKEKIEGAED